MSSRFFSVVAIEKPQSTTGRVASGIELAYRVTFKPESKDDYECDLVCVTEREKFLVKVRATSTSACLDCPDVLDFSVVPVRYKSERVRARNLLPPTPVLGLRYGQ